MYVGRSAIRSTIFGTLPQHINQLSHDPRRPIFIDLYTYVCRAFRHTERNIADTGLSLLLDICLSYEGSDSATEFYQAYLLQLLQEVFAVMTGDCLYVCLCVCVFVHACVHVCLCECREWRAFTPYTFILTLLSEDCSGLTERCVHITCQTLECFKVTDTFRKSGFKWCLRIFCFHASFGKSHPGFEQWFCRCVSKAGVFIRTHTCTSPEICMLT